MSNEIVFLLEEPSAKVMLEGFLPKLIPETYPVRYLVFEGKQDLFKQLPMKLRAWQNPSSHFVVLHDKDSSDCIKAKAATRALCEQAKQPTTLIRIACHELESWYLGDLAAVGRAFELPKLAQLQDKGKYRNPDQLANPVQEMKDLTKKGYQKVAGSRLIGPQLSIESNRSTSFNVFVTGIQALVARLNRIN